MVVTNARDNSISILFGNISGTFQSLKPQKVSTSPALVISTDFNRDTQPDLAVVNLLSGDVSI
jgi:hypothetical protein